MGGGQQRWVLCTQVIGQEDPSTGQGVMRRVERRIKLRERQTMSIENEKKTLASHELMCKIYGP